MNVTYIGNHSDEKPIYLVTDTIYAMSGSTLDAALEAEGYTRTSRPQGTRAPLAR